MSACPQLSACTTIVTAERLVSTSRRAARTAASADPSLRLSQSPHARVSAITFAGVSPMVRRRHAQVEAVEPPHRGASPDPCYRHRQVGSSSPQAHWIDEPVVRVATRTRRPSTLARRVTPPRAQGGPSPPTRSQKGLSPPMHPGVHPQDAYGFGRSLLRRPAAGTSTRRPSTYSLHEERCGRYLAKAFSVQIEIASLGREWSSFYMCVS